MRPDPVSERFRLGVPRVVFHVGASVLFLLLGTFDERGRRSVPVKVTVSVPADQTTPWLHVEMESQERGYLVRARWLVAAFHRRFRELYDELQDVTTPEPSTGDRRRP